MAQAFDISSIVEDTRQEMIFAIKERINEVTRGTSAPVQLKRVVVRDMATRSGDSLRYYEIKNVFLDESGGLCGDLAGKDDRYDGEVLFGKSIESLAADDLKLLLDSLYGAGWSVNCDDYEPVEHGRQERAYSFLMAKKAGISRMLRR
ncbi:MAG: hypothetical protein JXA07_00910 [Spirochaetes bacterium]|nr:hypothetical protein [Spirochaetota bacterium]